MGCGQNTAQTPSVGMVGALIGGMYGGPVTKAVPAKPAKPVVTFETSVQPVVDDVVVLRLTRDDARVLRNLMGTLGWENGHSSTPVITGWSWHLSIRPTRSMISATVDKLYCALQGVGI